MAVKDRIIIALDVSTKQDAVEMVRTLAGHASAFKVGLELFNSTGPEIFDLLKSEGAQRIFYDGKFHDIPNTVAGAARAAVRLGVWMFNVHASGGSDMMHSAADAAVDEAHRLGVECPRVLGVTVLTSISGDTLRNELGVCSPVADQVVHLARIAQDAGLTGVVASPREVVAVKQACGRDFLVVTPGVRPAWAAVNDQKRVRTPSEALRDGADYIVVGRSVTAADDPARAIERLISEIETDAQRTADA